MRPTVLTLARQRSSRIPPGAVAIAASRGRRIRWAGPIDGSTRLPGGERPGRHAGATRPCDRDRGPHRPRQDRARARPDRRRHRPAPGREAARDHDRPWLRLARPRRGPPRPGRRPRPRAVHPQHAGRGVGARPDHAHRRRGRFGDAPDPRAPGDPPLARPVGGPGRPDQVRPGRRGLARSGRRGRAGTGRGDVPGRFGHRPDLGGDGRGDRRTPGEPGPALRLGPGARRPRPFPDGDRPLVHRGGARNDRDRHRRVGLRRGRRRPGMAPRRPRGPRPRAATSRPAGRAGRARGAGRDQPRRRSSQRDPPRTGAGGSRLPSGHTRPLGRGPIVGRGPEAAPPSRPIPGSHRHGGGLGDPHRCSGRRASAHGTGLGQLFLAEPVVAVHGEPFVLREESPPATLGGGRVLQPSARRVRRRDRPRSTGWAGSARPTPPTRIAAALASYGLATWTDRTLCREAGRPDRRGRAGGRGRSPPPGRWWPCRSARGGRPASWPTSPPTSKGGPSAPSAGSTPPAPDRRRSPAPTSRRPWPTWRMTPWSRP